MKFHHCFLTILLTCGCTHGMDNKDYYAMTHAMKKLDIKKQEALSFEVANAQVVIQYFECGRLEQYFTTLGRLVQCKAMDPVEATNVFKEQQSTLKDEGSVVLNVFSRSSPLMRVAQ